MKPQILKEEISQLLDTIAEQVLMLNAETEKIPQIEIDLVMQNIRKLYEVFYDLDKANNQLYSARANEKAPLPSPAPVKEKSAPVRVEAPRREETLPPEPEEEPEPELPAEEEVIIRFEVPARETEPEPPAEPRPSARITPAKEAIPEPPPVIPPRAATPPKPANLDLFSGMNGSGSVADKYKAPGKSIKDRLEFPQEEPTVADRLHKEKIRSLKTAIGINEKFLFCNELFDQDVQEYEEVIHKLDNFRTGEEAWSFWRFLKERYQWNENDESYQKLSGMLRMKYS